MLHPALRALLAATLRGECDFPNVLDGGVRSAYVGEPDHERVDLTAGRAVEGDAQCCFDDSQLILKSVKKRPRRCTAK